MRSVVIAILVISSARVASAEPSQARALLQAQLATLDDPAGFIATLAPDTVVVGNGSLALAGAAEAPALIATLAPGPMPLLSVEATRVDIGEYGAATWLTADVSILRGAAPRRRQLSTARLSELVVADGDHARIVALAFTTSAGRRALGEALGPVTPGPLTALLVPLKLDAALREADTTVIIGPDDRVAIGAASAHRTLDGWRERDAWVTNAIAAHGSTWGFAIGDVDFTPDSGIVAAPHWRVLLFAIVDGERWRVVCAHVFAR